MREDQRRRLADIEDRLIEQTIADADPDNWSGAGQALREMNKETRGDAMWCRKTAVQTVALLATVQKLASDPAGALGKDDPTDGDIERAISRGEAEAVKLLERIQAKDAARPA